MSGQRYYGWLDTETGPLFSCLHRPAQDGCDIGVVLCCPLGHEYTHSHSTLVAMGDKLAAAGFPCLRFDYHGTGDSAGDSSQPDRVETWLANIGTAVAKLKATANVGKVCLLGLRMGATLAALYTEKTNADYLILWNPCTRGDAFVRDMQIMDQYHGGAEDNAEFMEFGGFVTTRETLSRYREINLAKTQFGATQNNLIIHKTGAPASSRLLQGLTERSRPAQQVTLPGYAEMMQQPQFSIVANSVIDYCCDWLDKQSAKSPPSETVPVEVATAAPMPDNEGVETIITFGDSGSLFGVLNRPLESSTLTRQSDSIFVISNTGAAHHVGPNRLHVELCRRLARAGLASFRFDLGNLGDSARNQPANLNHPYPPHALQDLKAAIDCLRENCGYRRFIVGGLCSGANVAFHGSLALTDTAISRAILINPLIFYWESGLSLATPQRQQQQIEKKYYAQSARSLGKWLKLFKGQVNIKALSGFLFKQAYLSVSALMSTWLEILRLKPPSRLGRDLARLESLRRPLDLLVSDSDPGYNIFLAEGRTRAKKSLKTQFVTAQFIANADHTFTTLGSRNDLIQRVLERVNT
ncbi:alpha/beta fold hydrolase [Exilibacterium tricleocarpae]|uniref:Alpha/beta fold hydrolase n=1 Tax=Exilibacterium tricleocarpae TaxID=2591008 RepID=A0A545T3I5_9GAMM|nr:alpha/beta fold hydrolase [Exilibacterium tricleocarpae]TQV71770.1 alpha/beta fold hydrolase [Exilibacterium tricleocarpae]